MERSLEQARVSPWEANGYPNAETYGKASELNAKAKQLENVAEKTFDEKLKADYAQQALELRAQAKALKNGESAPAPRKSMEDRLKERMAAMEAAQKREQPKEVEEPVKEHAEVIELQNDFSNEVTEQMLRHDPLDTLRGDKFFIRGQERERALEKYLGSLRTVYETGKLFFWPGRNPYGG